jgi:hypothetical protein
MLELAGLCVNKQKSFVKGFFRESCGKEYYRGVDITPCRLRALPDDSYDARMKVIAFHNNCYEKYGLQPIGLSALVHAWYHQVPERTIGMVRPHTTDLINPSTGEPPSLWAGMDGMIQNASHACVLNTYRAVNDHLRRRRVKALQLTQFRFLASVPCRFSYDKDDWSQLYRAVINPRTRMALGVDSLAKRVRYKYRWAQLH